MITLESFPARTFWEGPEDEVKSMLHCLRTKDKNAYWKAKFILRKVGYFAGTGNLNEREKKIEQLKKSTQWIKYYNSRSHSFPSGYLSRVKHRLEKKHIEYTIKRHRSQLQHLESVSHLQLEGVEERKEQLEALNAILQRRRGIVHAATNAGKTNIAIAAVKELFEQLDKKPRVLYLVHRIGLAMQTVKRFEQFGIEAHLLGGGRGKKIPKYGVLVAMVQTASKILYRSDRLQTFLEKCDCVFIDELHVNKAAMVEDIMDHCQAPMRIGMSGTIKNKGEKYMHYLGMCGNIIAETKNEELVNLGRSAKPFIRIRTVREPFVEGNYLESYREGIVRHLERNRMVVRETVRYVDKGKRTLVLVSRKAHGWKLLNMFQKRVDVPVQFIQGSTPIAARDKAVRLFVSGKAPILISSPILDVGFDLPEIDAAVFAGAGKGWELVLQRLGRLLRKKKGSNRVYLTEFLDLHNKYLRKHSKRRLKYYRAENIAEIELVDKEKK